MKIKYYGTGAGYGIPELFCNCSVCEYARKHGGKNIRTRSLAVLDDCIAIDLSVDAFHHNAFSGLNMKNIHHILITHNHHDHFFTPDIFTRAKNMLQPAKIYITKESGKELSEIVKRFNEDFTTGAKDPEKFTKVEMHTIEVKKPIKIMQYTVVPLKARHADNLNAVMFVISHASKNMLWAHDTGLFLDDTVEWIKNSGIVFDFVSLDCTLKRGEQITQSHMDLDWCLQMANLLRSNGNADENTKFVISHIGHLVEKNHDQLVEEAKEVGMTVAFDGMEIVF